MPNARIATGLLSTVLACALPVFESRAGQDGPPAVTAQPEGVRFSKTTYVYKTVKDCKIQADVYRAAGDEIRPVILWIHGGALIFSSRGSLRQREDQLQRYLQGGYVVVSIDYRMAPETKLPAIIEDLQDAYQWLHGEGPELFRVDPERIAVVGNSAGGYLALMSGFCVTPRPKAIVSFYGYGDITGDWTTKPSPHHLQVDEPISKERAYESIGKHEISESPLFPRVVFYNYCRQNGLWPREVTGYDPITQAKELERFCPIRHVTPDYPPTLFLHGDKDTDVPFEQSVLMAAALKEHQVPHRLIRMENRDHLFDVFDSFSSPDRKPVGLKDPKVAEAFDAMLAFLDEHVGR